MAENQKPKVFISYSRKDSTDFADELVAGLELAGFEPFIDRHDIAAGEDWETRLGGLIQDADTVVYVISPEAVKSERCAWEVDKTLALSKRLIPVIFKPVRETDIPQSLRRLQFIRFDQGLGITRPLAQLAEALRQDLDWIREHTRIAAVRWEARGRPSSLLLRGDDLDAARIWIAKRKPGTPEITEAQTSLINASIADSRTARRRTRLTQALIATLFAIIVLGLTAYWNEQSLGPTYHWLAHVHSHVLTAESERKLKPTNSFRECVGTDGDYSKYCPEMIVVPAGKFMMGSPRTESGRGLDEGPQHEVAIALPFAVSKFEVTFDQWDVCNEYGGCAAVWSIYRGGKQPANNVSWYDAQQYVKWLSSLTGQRYRLLTEAEWEYAARAGSVTPYSFEGNLHWQLGEYAWYGANSGGSINPVGEKKSNAFGLYDMYGNVAEWVEDCYHENFNGSPTNGSAWVEDNCIDRVFRGGSYSTTSENYLRSASRGRAPPNNRAFTIGFRVGRTLLPPSVKSANGML